MRFLPDRYTALCPAPPGLFARFKQDDGTTDRSRIVALGIVDEAADPKNDTIACSTVVPLVLFEDGIEEVAGFANFEGYTGGEYE